MNDFEIEARAAYIDWYKNQCNYHEGPGASKKFLAGVRWMQKRHERLMQLAEEAVEPCPISGGVEEVLEEHRRRLVALAEEILKVKEDPAEENG